MIAKAGSLLPLPTEAVRMIMRDGEPWWVGQDVVSALGIADAPQALGSLEEYERSTELMATGRGSQSMIIINESGFYSLLFRSRKPIAAAFKRWLTCEVLPSIRRHGTYPPPAQPALPPDTEEWHDGRAKSLATRFREERLRWQAETGYPLDHRNSFFSTATIRAIEDGVTRELKPTRVYQLVLLGIDALYVITGQRTLTPGERRMRDAYRTLPPAERAQLHAVAARAIAALPPPTD